MYLFFELCTLKILCNDERFLGCAKTKKILKKYESAKKHFPFLDLALKRTRQKETRNLFLSGPSKNQSKFLI